MNLVHVPVLLNEVLHYLNPLPGKNYIDATADGGGHAIAILEAIRPSGKLLAIEWDEELFEKLKHRLKKECPQSSNNCKLCRANYADLAACARSLKLGPVSGVLFDLGMSSFHIEESRRGFSFRKEEPLDMRYSRSGGETAKDIINKSASEELEKTLKEFGEERFARAIAKEIIRSRQKKRIETTGELVEVVRRATPAWYHRSRLHFATRTFQALRIAANQEIENLEQGLRAAAEITAPGGRIIIISFHSLEDRTAKNFFRHPEIKSDFDAITKKPITPSASEVRANPRARSAKMRIFEKNDLHPKN